MIDLKKTWLAPAFIEGKVVNRIRGEEQIYTIGWRRLSSLVRGYVSVDEARGVLNSAIFALSESLGGLRD